MTYKAEARIFHPRKSFYHLIEGPRGPSANARVLARALNEGVYCFPGQTSVIMIAPPLTVTRQEIDHEMSVSYEALAIADKVTV